MTGLIIFILLIAVVLIAMLFVGSRIKPTDDKSGSTPGGGGDSG
jgi:hypothetical protein